MGQRISSSLAFLGLLILLLSQHSLAHSRRLGNIHTAATTQNFQGPQNVQQGQTAQLQPPAGSDRFPGVADPPCTCFKTCEYVFSRSPCRCRINWSCAGGLGFGSFTPSQGSSSSVDPFLK